MNILARITGIKYKPLLCRKLETFSLDNLESALSSKATFILNAGNKNNFAVSRWVSAKRTRSYPYARVYDSLEFTGKKITIIPVLKDEGAEGDNDSLQWDTISLMSLLDIYVIIGYYKYAKSSKRYEHKITSQRFDTNYLKAEIKKLPSYHSDALHWNLEQIGKISEIGQKALESYADISNELGIRMHSRTPFEKKIAKLLESKEEFMSFSRTLAKRAQKRESLTTQPKEMVSGTKATITIKNYLGGYYYFTSDEVEIRQNNIYLIECKHSKTNSLPSLADIKDGLLKMILFTNLEEVRIGNKNYNPVPVLKLTVEKGFHEKYISKSQRDFLVHLNEEAELNGFRVSII